MRLRRGQGLLWTLGIVILLGLGELALRARYRQLVLPAGGAKSDRDYDRGPGRFDHSRVAGVAGAGVAGTA